MDNAIGKTVKFVEVISYKNRVVIGFTDKSRMLVDYVFGQDDEETYYNVEVTYED